MKKSIRPRSLYEYEIIGKIKHTLSNEFKLSNERQRELLQFMIDDIDSEEKVLPDAITKLEEDIFCCKAVLAIVFVFCMYALYKLNHINYVR